MFDKIKLITLYMKDYLGNELINYQYVVKGNVGKEPSKRLIDKFDFSRMNICLINSFKYY